MTLIKEWLQQTIAELEEERDAVPGVVNEDAAMALAAMKLALASLEANPVSVNDDMAYAFHHAISDSSLGSDEVEEIKAGLRAAFANVTAQPAPASVPDDVSGPLAHAYKELTPTFMRNHIDVFERYGIYPDGSAGIQAMRIALDGMNRRAAMLQGADDVGSWNNNKNTPSLREAVGAIRNSGIAIDAEKILAERDALNSPVIPDGWVMVPVEPTAAMISSGIAAHFERSQTQIHDRPAPGPMECAYVAMLAAAPQQEVK